MRGSTHRAVAGWVVAMGGASLPVSGVAVGASADVLYNIADLTPDGWSTSVAYDINADGDAVGIAGRFNPSFEEAYFYYDHSEGTSTVFGLGTVIPRGAIVGTGFREAAINDSGLVAGTARFLGGVTESRGFVYNGSTFTNLGTLPGATATGIRPASDALDINNAGLATGTATSGAGTTPQESDNLDIYLNSASPLTDIDGDITVATRGDKGRAVNNLGTVAGSNQDGRATLFSGITETVLTAGTPIAANGSEAFDVNDTGQAAVQDNVDQRGYHYDPTNGLTIIPSLGSGTRTFAKAINGDGDIVGNGDRTQGTSGQNRGFLYDATAGTTTILEDRVVDKSVPAVDGLGDWEQLGTAWGINDDGWIVGQGSRRFTGNTFPTNRAYLLMPESFGTGDYDASGQVEQGDLDLVLQNWGLTTPPTPSGWINDLPDGVVDQAELDKVLQNWGSTSAPVFDGSTVPEPAGLTALLLATGMRRPATGTSRG